MGSTGLSQNAADGFDFGAILSIFELQNELKVSQVFLIPDFVVKEPYSDLIMALSTNQTTDFLEDFVGVTKLGYNSMVSHLTLIIGISDTSGYLIADVLTGFPEKESANDYFRVSRLSVTKDPILLVVSGLFAQMIAYFISKTFEMLGLVMKF